MVLPDRETCLRMLKDAGCEENVIEHCKLVEAVALGFANREAMASDEDLESLHGEARFQALIAPLEVAEP